MNQLTVRGFDDELAEAIRKLAKREGTSLNQAALQLLRKGVGLDDRSAARGVIGPALDHLIGSWTPDEADEMDNALEEFEAIHEPSWK